MVEQIAVFGLILFGKNTEFIKPQYIKPTILEWTEFWTSVRFIQFRLKLKSFFSCATFLYQKSLNFKNVVDDPYMLLGNMYKTFTKTFTISNDEESLLHSPNIQRGAQEKSIPLLAVDNKYVYFFQNICKTYKSPRHSNSLNISDNLALIKQCG